MQMDRPIVLIQLGIPLVGQRTMKAVPSAKSSPQRPVVLRPGCTIMCDIGKMPLADRVGAIARVAENLWDNCRPRGDLPSVSRVPLDHSAIIPIPPACALRPVNRHARVGEHMEVTWKFEYRTPPLASWSIHGVAISEP